MKSWWIGIVFVVLIGLSVLGVLSVSTRLVDVAGEEPAQALMQLFDANAVGYEEGALAWEFRARFIETAKTAPTTTIEGITSGRAFDSEGEVFCLSATRAVYEARKRTLTVEGGIQMDFRDSNRLECARMIWDARSRVLRSPGSVRLWLGSRGSLSGRNLVADMESEEITMDDVEATLRLAAPEGEAGGSGA